MNLAERNVATILTLARLVENSLVYCVKRPEPFSAEDRRKRGNVLQNLTRPSTPFAVNCEKNGEQGKKLAEDMKYFIEDVYGDPGRIVTVDINDNVHVEQSLTIELFSTIVHLRLYLEGFLKSALQYLKESNQLEESFAKAVSSDIRLYHALAGKIGSQMIYDKFIEVNENASTYMQSYSKSHGGIDPRKDKDFKVDDDPSVRMLKNEFHELNQDLVNVLNTYGEDDEEFRFARQSLYADCELFTGQKKPTDLKAFRQLFVGYFDKIIRQAEKESNDCFRSLGDEMLAFDQARRTATEEKNND